MRVIIANTAQEVALIAAKHCIATMHKKNAAVLGLATGSTPVSLYTELINQYQQGLVSFRHCYTFNLDEYIGIESSHPQSYRYFMQEHLFKHIDIEKKRTFILDGMGNPQQSAIRFERKIKELGGIDIQVLGIGRNGHIGFNEPNSSLISRTRIKKLAAQTLKDNKRFFQDGHFQPHLAITLGIGTILEAKKILLLATGTTKSTAVCNLIEGPVSPSCPASALQKHANTIVIIDNQAAADLAHQADYEKSPQQVSLMENNYE